LLKITLTI